MTPRESVLWQVPTLLLFAGLFGVSTAYMKSTMCIEGGTVIGYPRYFYAQCYAYAPGGPLGSAEFVLASLLIDVVFWYLVSMILVLAVVVAHRRIRGI